jgi:hypothetical protein
MVGAGRGRRGGGAQNNYDIIHHRILKIFHSLYVKCDLVFGKMTVLPNIRAHQHA